MLSFKNCRVVRMSNGTYELVRDLGFVKGGRGLRTHQTLVSFSLQTFMQGGKMKIRMPLLSILNRWSANA